MRTQSIVLKALLMLVVMATMATKLHAQTPLPPGRDPRDKILVYGIVVDGDTLPLIKLPEIRISAAPCLLSAQEIRKNQKLIRNVKKMLPYARMAKKELDKIEHEAAQLSAKQRKELIKRTEQEMLAQYTEELKRFTFSQGKVLLKLVDRETGQTSYVIVNELRGKLRAGFYQTFAKLFGYNLKLQYDPKNNKEDNLIERIVLSVDAHKL